MMFTLEIYKDDKRTKTGQRFIGKYDYDRKDRAAMEQEVSALYPLYNKADGYRFNIVETMVTRQNAITGKEYQERYDTPSFCSPSSESYWSM